jgi:hypothetical protein
MHPMHTLIVCGTPWCQLDSIHAQLLAAGLANPLPAASSSVSTIADWYQRVFAHRLSDTQPVHPGKAWEQAAGEIFLANWEQPLWGWSDARSTWLLDFWLQFDPQVRFVLVHTPAADALVAAALQPHGAEFDANQVLDAWCAHQAHMLQFGLRHRDRCVWFPHVQTPDIVTQNTPASIEASDVALQVLAEEAAEAPQGAEIAASPATVASVALQWDVPIKLPLLRPVKPKPVGPTLTLLQSLAAQAVQQHPQSRALQEEVWASLPTLDVAPAAPAVLPGKQQAAQLLSQVRQVVVVQVSDLRRQLSEQVQAKEALQATAAQAKNQDKALASSLQQQLHREQQAKQALQADIAQKTKAHADTEQEAELLLLQLHQVQEELEKTLPEAAELRQQLQTATQAKNQDKALASSLQQQLQQEQQAKQALQADIAQKTKAHAGAEQEAELLLLQLHQVQEELEHYFLQHQQAQQTSQQLQDRLTRWAQRYPDHCEWDSLAVLPHTKPHWQQVLITQLQQGGRTLPQLHLQLHHTKKLTQLLLCPAADGTLPLLRWPTQTTESGAPTPVAEVVLNPAAKLGTPEFAILAALAPSDLQLLQAVCKAVAHHLQANPSTCGAEGETWAAQWQAMAQSLGSLPPHWRFDGVSLRHEQVNPDYEHLWFRLDQAQYGTHQWPVFEFRLSANNVRKGKWSHLPKLEFPLPDHNGPKQFDNWYEESEDDKGPKFELRFDMKGPGVDMNCWSALSPADQTQTLALVHSLPGLLQQLEHTGTRIHRPWADWQTLASGIQYALVTCLGLGAVPLTA